MADLKFYFTGAEQFNETQRNPDKSLGGWRSSDELSNDFLNNLFSDISYESLRNFYTEVKGIMIFNDTASAMTNLRLYLNYPDGLTFSKIFIAPVTLNNQESMEKIGNFRSSPLAIDQFYDAVGLANEQTLIASLPAGEGIGLWLKREILEDHPLVGVNCEDIQSVYDGLEKTENVQLIFTWD